MPKTKLVQTVKKCPKCGQTQVSRYPLLTLNYFPRGYDFQFCTNCQWDNFPQTGLTKLEYQYFWQRYRMMWNNHFKARPMTRWYHASQAMINFMVVFICPQWLVKHFGEALWWIPNGKHFHEVEWPNRAYTDLWEIKANDPKYTFTDFMAVRKDMTERPEKYFQDVDDCEPDYWDYQ